MRDAEQRDAHAAPDGYAPGIAKLRAANAAQTPTRDDDTEQRLRAMREFRGQFTATVAASRLAAENPATGRIYANPPDGHALAIECLRKEGR